MRPLAHQRFHHDSHPLKLAFLLGMPGLVMWSGTCATAQTINREQAMRAAIHAVGDATTMNAWLSRVPVTKDYPGDFGVTLGGQGSLYVIEMSTAAGCIPCGDLWTKLQRLGRRYGWRVQAIGGAEAMIRSGRLGLPWVGHPVAWVRPTSDAARMVPIAIGTDHEPNIARNLYLAAKMLTGVRPEVGVRAMSKFTGIVGVATAPTRSVPGG